MRNLLVCSAAVGLMAGSSLAGSTTLTPLGGVLGSPFDTGMLHGYGYDFAAGSGNMVGSFDLYNDIPTVLGGLGTPGTVLGNPAAFLFADWALDPEAQIGDDLHGISLGGPGPAVVTGIWYAYANLVASATHVVKIYDMNPPSVVPTMTAPSNKGILLASITLPAMPVGTYAVSMTVPSFVLPHSAVWIKFEEQGQGFPDTYWLAGGNPGIGTSAPGLTGTKKVDGEILRNYFAPLPYIYAPGMMIGQSNLAVGLAGYHLPAPGTIALLGLGGLAAMRRRRIA